MPLHATTPEIILFRKGKDKLIFVYERAVVFPKRDIYELKLSCHPPARISTPIKKEGSSPLPNCRSVWATRGCH